MSAEDGYDIPGYDIVRRLGEGGMATVFLAIQKSLNRRVAIKVMSHNRGDAAAQKRFMLEGQTLARLPHSNIVAVYDVVQTADMDYIVMECLEGGVLSERMRTGWLTLNDFITFVVQIAGALQFAHDNGVVHRDLKPDNILFRDARTPVLTDFGIVRVQDNTGERRITEAGMVIGTPTYMSPEQATGGEIDGRSDQYSLGILFYEMLAGKPPFTGDTPMQIAYAQVNKAPPPLPSQYAFAQPLIDRMLAKKPADRYPDLKVFVRELKGALTGSPLLQKRLQMQPGDDVSEQLKAMGFTESMTQTRTPMPMVALEAPAGGLVHSLLENSKLELEPVKERPREIKVEQPKGPSLALLVPLLLIVIAGAMAAIKYLL